MSLAGKVVAFTGKLESFTRAEAASKVKDSGGVVSSSVTKKTTHLVVGTDGKVDKASPGTVVWTEAEFTAAITPTSSVDANVESAPTPPMVIHVSVKDEVDPQPVLEGKVVSFTGKLESFTRAEAASKVKDAGGVVSSSVTKKTTHLVVGSDGKVDKAAPGTVVWTETEFTAALAKATSKAVPSPTSPVAMSVKNEATSAAVGKGKKRAAAAPPTTPEKKPKTEATIKSSPVRVTTRKPDKHLAGRDQFTIVDDFTTDLMQTNIGENNNKFYILQLVATSGQYHVFTRWGRLGDVGQQQLADCGDDLDKAILLFEKKFKDKTKNKWSDRHAFVKHDLQYQLVELDASESGDGGGGGDAAMGKLSAAQVHKGQAVLDKLLVALERNPGAVTALSGEYYSLIPTLSGRQRPPPLDSIELIHEKAALLDTTLTLYFSRSENRTAIRKYFNYLRVFLEAMCRMPQKEQTLWRGVSVDLFDAYEPGKVITWWGVSSCTSDENVARNFMRSCGGSCTLLRVRCKTAMDISVLSMFPGEKECLLAPGTQLKVVKRTRNGNIAEIEVEEVGRAI
ncbi:hypothetical protein DYB25_007903 [Aphanomyces astaci]|uniref:NAD(P)(+)--arginine ADP-ribosyltransferase n=2 Tax=Aphanomyces astaci TaxID=112090 RepID=A0A397BVX2_APHAT|nr:hypothetical protein DYB25_007903 [Aphanomyces astaci]